MNIKSVKYSSKNGYTFELEAPDVIRVTTHEVLLILLLLKANVSQDQLTAEFNEEEQAVIQRYELLRYQTQLAYTEKDYSSIRPKVLQKQLTTQLEELQATFYYSEDEVIRKSRQWVPLVTQADQEYLKAMKTNKKRHYFEWLERHFGPPSRWLLRQLEAYYANIEPPRAF
jgi:hypothetical protein